MDGIQDFFEEHPNIGKVIRYFVVAAVAFCATFFPALNWVNDLEAEAVAEHEARLIAEQANTDAIDVLEDWYLEFYGDEGEWQTFLTALEDYITATEDAITDKDTRLITLEDWYEDFYGEDGEWQELMVAWDEFYNDDFDPQTGYSKGEFQEAVERLWAAIAELQAQPPQIIYIEE